MGLETGTYISDLVATNPLGSDAKSSGDDHIRLVKSTVKATFPNISGAVTPTHTELNYVSGVTSAIQTQLNAKAPKDSPVFTTAVTLPYATIIGSTTAAQLAYLQGVTSPIQTQIAAKAPSDSPTFTTAATLPTATTIGTTTAAELGYVHGVTSAIQTQINTKQTNIDAKGAITGQVWTGSHDFTGATATASTQTVGDSTTKVATTAFVAATSLVSALPGQTGNAGKFITTDGTNASWQGIGNNYSGRTANTILAKADQGYIIDITSGTFAQTFSAVATLGAGWGCYIRNSGTGTITLTPNGAETINGAATYTLLPGYTAMIQCDGSVLRVAFVLATNNGQYLHVRDEKANTTHGGTSSTGINIRTLNTVNINTIAGASLASNRVTLPSGTYGFKAYAPRYDTSGTPSRLSLYNYTDSTYIMTGSGTPSNGSMDCVEGRFTLSASKEVQLSHYIALTYATIGLGNAASTGQVEVYAELQIWKVA